MQIYGIGGDSRSDPRFMLPDELWERVVPLLPPPKEKKKQGRPRHDDRLALAGIYYRLRTGCQWKALPRCFGAPSTVHDRFQEWAEDGLFERLHAAGLLEGEATGQLDWLWQAVDTSSGKAPLGGELTGPNPTDRGKLGVKRSIHVDGNGIPLGGTIAAANRTDMKALPATLGASPIDRPATTEAKQNICLDKGYDYPEIYALLERLGYVPHIRPIGEDASTVKRTPGHKPRRWVAERTLSWLNRFRAVLVRWEKKAVNYMALVDFALAIITFRCIGLFG